MFRAFTAASILVLSVTAAQAGSTTDASVDPRIYQAANDVCGHLLQSKHYTPLFYQSWYRDCMRMSSTEIKRRVEARAGRYPAFARN